MSGRPSPSSRTTYPLFVPTANRLSRTLHKEINFSFDPKEYFATRVSPSPLLAAASRSMGGCALALSYRKALFSKWTIFTSLEILTFFLVALTAGLTALVVVVVVVLLFTANFNVLRLALRSSPCKTRTRRLLYSRSYWMSTSSVTPRCNRLRSVIAPFMSYYGKCGCGSHMRNTRAFLFILLLIYTYAIHYANLRSSVIDLVACST